MESFFESYQHTIDFFVAVGTWGAVFTSLFLARDSMHPKLRIFVDAKVLIPSHAQTDNGKINREQCEDIISVNMQNIGQTTVYIPYFSFYWKLPFFSTVVNHNPFQPDFRKDGLKIDPGQEVSIILANDISKLKSDVFIQLCVRHHVHLGLPRRE